MSYKALNEGISKISEVYMYPYDDEYDYTNDWLFSDDEGDDLTLGDDDLTFEAVYDGPRVDKLKECGNAHINEQNCADDIDIEEALTESNSTSTVEEDFSADGDYWFNGQRKKGNRYKVERRSRDEKHSNSILSKGQDYFTGEGTIEGKSKAKEIRDFDDDFYSAEDYYKDNLSDKYDQRRRNKKDDPNEGKVVENLNEGTDKGAAVDYILKALDTVRSDMDIDGIVPTRKIFLTAFKQFLRKADLDESLCEGIDNIHKGDTLTVIYEKDGDRKEDFFEVDRDYSSVEQLETVMKATLSADKIINYFQ